jgi:hypothetical protein
MNEPLTDKQMSLLIWKRVNESVQRATEELVSAVANNARQVAGKTAWEREDEANYGGGMDRPCPYDTNQTEVAVLNAREHLNKWRQTLEFATKKFLS